MDKNDKGQFESKYEVTDYKNIYQNYIEWITTTIEKDTTVTRLREDLKFFFYWLGKREIHPHDVTEQDVQSLIKEMQLDEVAGTTLTRIIASVSKYYIYATNDPDIGEDVTENPVADINLSKDYGIDNTSNYLTVLSREGREDIIAPDYEELKPMFDHPPGENPATQTRNELICRLLWQTAMRSEELSRIKKDNIDWDEQSIYLRSAKLNDEQDLYKRYVYFEDNLKLLLRRWIDSHRSQLNPKANDKYLIIGSANGHEPDDSYDYQLAPSTISRIVKDAASNAGIQEGMVKDADGDVKRWLYTAHRLRHARITHLANKTDMSIHFVRMIAGHEQLDTTMDYVQEDWDECRDAFHKTY